MIRILLSLSLTTAIILVTFTISGLPLSLFINTEGLIIVLGGTVSIFSFLIPENFVKDLVFGFKILISRGSRRATRLSEIRSLLNSFKQTGVGINIEDENMKTCHQWLELGLDKEKTEILVTDLYRNDIEKLQRLALAFGSLAKYPPALGMIGTVFGIIGIFNGLSQEGAQLNLGSNLAFAMTATLYGLLLSNFIFSPLSELIDQIVVEEEALSELTLDAVLELSKGDSLTFISEHLNTHEK